MLTNLHGPNPIDLDFLRQWFERPSMAAFPLRGLDMAAWDDTTDLIAIKPRLTPDPLSRWLTNTFFPAYHRLFGEKVKVKLASILERICLLIRTIDTRDTRAWRRDLLLQGITACHHYQRSRYRRGLSGASPFHCRALHFGVVRE